MKQFLWLLCESKSIRGYFFNRLNINIDAKMTDVNIVLDVK